LGKTFVIHCASTTGNVIVTNANGSDTILGALSVAVSATNRLAVRRLSTGYW
jgi:hypothetical protein